MHCFLDKLRQFSFILKAGRHERTPWNAVCRLSSLLSTCVRSPPTPDLCSPVPSMHPTQPKSEKPAQVTQPSQVRKTCQPSWAPLSFTHIQKPPSPEFSLSKAPWFLSSQPPKRGFVTVYWNSETTVYVVLPPSICFHRLLSHLSETTSLSLSLACRMSVKGLQWLQEKSQGLHRHSWPVFVFSYLSDLFPALSKAPPQCIKHPSLFLPGFSRAF